MDLSVKIGGKALPNPVGAASGTIGYGSEYEALVDYRTLGALYTKAITREPREGNPIPRIVETTAGLLNSIGLANVGMERFVTEKWPYLKTLPCPVIGNIAGSDPEEYAEVVSFLEAHTDLWGYEINISCPNVKKGGITIGTDPTTVERLTRTLRDLTTKPLIVKLTPNVTDIAEIARAAEAGGADALSCINTVVGMAIDIRKKRPVIPQKTAGLSGPAIKPIGVAAVYRVRTAVRIPIIGIGGIMEPEDAIEYLLAGATAVQVGTALFVDPRTPSRILKGITSYMAQEGFTSLEDFHRFWPQW
ncbi:dihydroorotate dehydrogenase [Spirochaeta thermophila]|uniref:Dihydroorotate dehydrogenase n=1 Tax=Winmispira thermophila (strain ATCC 49972 / DSM 6192 / RI 19.B1) TaxID=665571 RepID=E0RQT8_WINT6|nr:dihydroorotate dehydrogenase [Spirochaeta thermophila]ADN02994.1 dihydroorotate dehydrogenase [Spirochaeta thermophila DSM 6192]